MPHWSKANQAASALTPGVLSAVIVAIAALFLSQHYGASAMLFALLLGMAMNFLGQEGKCVEGIQFAASTILRIGVALLGLRITFAEIAGLGVGTLLMVMGAVVATILFGRLFVRFTQAAPHFGILTGGAVAICGASAALAIASLLPRGPHRERDTTFTVIGVTALSTLAMVIYPVISTAMGFTPREAGVFLGATIHDVAQVVGAGYSVGKEAGDVATVVKLLRVAMLLPVIFILSLMWRANTEGASRPPLLPWFAVAFALFVALNSAVALPKSLLVIAGDVSRFALVVAIAAIGMRTSLKELTVLGMRPVMLMVAETVFLAAVIIVAMKYVLP
jgi:uncharacterized integral membrane protein (TIGR00698 family)